MDRIAIDRIPLFDTLDADERDCVASHFVLHCYPKKAGIINAGDDTNSLYIILYGRVKIYLTDHDGKEVILNTQGPVNTSVKSRCSMKDHTAAWHMCCAE